MSGGLLVFLPSCPHFSSWDAVLLRKHFVLQTRSLFRKLNKNLFFNVNLGKEEVGIILNAASSFYPIRVASRSTKELYFKEAVDISRVNLKQMLRDRVGIVVRWSPYATAIEDAQYDRCFGWLSSILFLPFSVHPLLPSKLIDFCILCQGSRQSFFRCRFNPL